MMWMNFEHWPLWQAEVKKGGLEGSRPCRYGPKISASIYGIQTLHNASDGKLLDMRFSARATPRPSPSK